MASLAASSPRAQRQTAPDSATRRMASLTSSPPSPHSRSAPGSSIRSRASAAASSPHRHSAPGSSTLAASSPRAQRQTAPDPATRRMASLASSSPSPHHHSAPGSSTRSRASLAAASPHRHSAPGSSTLAAPSSSPGTPTSSPPHPVDSVRVYALRDSCMEFVAELGRTDRSHDAAKVREESPAGSEERGDIFLAFMSKGSLCGIATLVADAPGQGSMKSDHDEEEEEEEDECTGDDEDSEGDEDEEEEEEEDECTDDVTDESSNSKDSENEAEEEDEYEDAGDDGWIWQKDNAEKQEEKSESAYSLKIRVWPSCGYANIVLFDGMSWISTTSYCLTWLSRAECEIMLEKFPGLSPIDMKVGDSRFVSNAVFPRSEYEGVLVNSWAVQMLVQHKLRPSIYDFIDEELLGKGADCNVRLCTSRYDKKDYAIKIIKIKEYDPSEPREVAILSSLRSQHVVKFYQAWRENHIFVDYKECSDYEGDSRKSGKGPRDMQHPKYVLIHMEFCSGSLQGYLLTKSRKIDTETLRIFMEIIRGLQYIHGENVIHRDLKPANIFVGIDGRIKIGDFGQSRVRPLHGGSFKGTPNLGTVYYEAPELGEAENISEKVDIYSLGAIYLELFSFFTTVLEKGIMIQTFKTDNLTSTDFKGDVLLLKKMIASDPIERPSVDDLVDYFSKL